MHTEQFLWKMDTQGTVEHVIQDLITFLYPMLLVQKFPDSPLIMNHRKIADLMQLLIEFIFEEEPIKGPGIVNVKTKILADPDLKSCYKTDDKSS